MANRRRIKGRTTLLYKTARSLKVAVDVRRGSEVPFAACARVDAPGQNIRFPGSQCAKGKNPRQAIAGALHKLAKVLNKRKGAFAGRR